MFKKGETREQKSNLQCENTELEVAVNSGWRDVRISSYVWWPYFFHDDSTGRLTESPTLVPRQIIIVQCALYSGRSGGSTPRRCRRITWLSSANRTSDKGLCKLSNRSNFPNTLKILHIVSTLLDPTRLYRVVHRTVILLTTWNRMK